MLRHANHNCLLLVASLLAWLLLPVRADNQMIPFHIRLPQHDIQFALPSDMARSMGEGKIMRSFDPSDEAFVRDGFREIAGTLFDTGGTFWSGAHGSLRFHLMVQKKDENQSVNISTANGLKQYIAVQRTPFNKNGFIPDTRLLSLNSMTVVVREYNSFGSSDASKHERLLIVSIPIDDAMYVDLGLHVIEWKAGRGASNHWKQVADGLAEQIKASIRVAPREAQASRHPQRSSVESDD